MRDLDIVHFIIDKDNYDKFSGEINSEVFSEEAHQLYRALGAYYTEHKESLTPETFKQWFLNFRTHGQEDTDHYHRVFDLLLQCRTETEDVIRKEIVKKKLKKEMTELISSGDCTPADIEELATKYKTTYGNKTTSEQYEDKSTVADLFKDTPAKTGYKWGFPRLDAYLGPMPHIGCFTIFGSLVNAGKSTFMLNLIKNIAPQLPPGKQVLMMVNENVASVYMRRFACLMTGLTSSQLEYQIDQGHDPTAYINEKLGGNRIKWYSIAGCTTGTVHQIIKDNKETVGLIILDMLDVILPTPSERRLIVNSPNDATPELLYTFALNIACCYASVVVTSQLADGNYDKTEPPLEALKGSRVAKQGKATNIIMMGCKPYDPLRYISIPKKKQGEVRGKFKSAMILNELTGIFEEV